MLINFTQLIKLVPLTAHDRSVRLLSKLHPERPGQQDEEGGSPGPYKPHETVPSSSEDIGGEMFAEAHVGVMAEPNVRPVIGRLELWI